MRKVRQHFPANRLAAALAIARPRSVEQSLQQAADNIGQLTQECSAHVDAGLASLETALQNWPAEPCEALLLQIYRSSLRMVGVASIAGLDHLDQAAASLCDVADGLFAKELWEREPIAVHVRAMRLLRCPNSLGQRGASILLAGLAKVRIRYAAESSLQSHSYTLG